MSNELIEQLAREAGFDAEPGRPISFEGYLVGEEIARFAALVAEHIGKQFDEQASTIGHRMLCDGKPTTHAQLAVSLWQQAAGGAREMFPMPKD